ncbi:MAG: RNHCP domain-containing protein [Ruminococcaceae bacterium]|nr:RNHCP domain-containing protein [Oscillospiraceae bacterium]
MKNKINENKNINGSEGKSADRFICANCGKPISCEGAGSRHRNHCPHCLSSLHLDNIPGDRAADCGGIMDPIGVWVRRDGEWAVIHRCRSCGHLSSNRIAADDNPVKLLSIALKPLALPPFPLESVEDMISDK